MHRLICAFVVRIWHTQVFSWCGSFKTSLISSTTCTHRADKAKPIKWCVSTVQQRLRSVCAQSFLSAWRSTDVRLTRVYCHVGPVRWCHVIFVVLWLKMSLILYGMCWMGCWDSSYPCCLAHLRNTVCILINALSHFLWENAAKCHTRHWKFAIFAPILSQECHFLELLNCSTPGVFIRINTVYATFAEIPRKKQNVALKLRFNLCKLTFSNL